jgi:hypothetical protein
MHCGNAMVHPIFISEERLKNYCNNLINDILASRTEKWANILSKEVVDLNKASRP